MFFWHRCHPWQGKWIIDNKHFKRVDLLQKKRKNNPAFPFSDALNRMICSIHQILGVLASCVLPSFWVMILVSWHLAVAEGIRGKKETAPHFHAFLSGSLGWESKIKVLKQHQHQRAPQCSKSKHDEPAFQILLGLSSYLIITLEGGR